MRGGNRIITGEGTIASQSGFVDMCPDRCRFRGMMQSGVYMASCATHLIQICCFRCIICKKKSVLHVYLLHMYYSCIPTHVIHYIIFVRHLYYRCELHVQYTRISHMYYTCITHIIHM